jgi:hypothetical protein
MIGVWIKFTSQVGWDQINVSSPRAPAWRLCWIEDDGREWTHIYAFRRRMDAELALAALERNGVTLRDFQEIVVGEEWKWNKVMIESLQW